MDYYKLNDCAYYREERTKQIDFETYITTDNMLPNRGGVVKAESLPDAKTVTKYKPCDVLLSNIRPYFKKIWFSNREGGCSNDVLVITAKSEVDSKFLYYVLSDNNFFNYDNVTSKGTKMPRGTPNAIMKYLVPKMSMLKQKRIVSILSAYDNMIEVNNKRIKVLEQIAENLYKEWFARFRFPGHETSEFENGIPNGWEYKKLFDVAKVTYGYAFSSDEFCDDESLNAVVRIRDVPNNETKTYTSEQCSNKYLIEENAILVGMDGIFHMCLWSGKKAYLNQRVVKIESTYNSMCNYFLLLSIAPQVKFWEQAIAGTTVAHLGDKHLKKMLVLVPESNVLNKANEILDKIMIEKNALFKQNRFLIKQRDMLLPRLMSGKLEV